ncbi:alpha/beta-hydrolase [Gloeopeniophorella convolvens]|nr:alpha/beta-hydrolase [Gloeopeniophorella convolvens]
MTDQEWQKLGVFAYLDSGAPPTGTSGDYTTLVLLHGYGRPADIFGRLLPLANGGVSSRIVLINRRGYPGSDPFTDEELAALSPTVQDASEGSKSAAHFMKERARELYDFLGRLIKSGGLSDNSVIIGGFSIGSSWMTALLAHAASFGAEDFNLAQYIRRVVLLDPPSVATGYPFPEGAYYPLTDPSFTPEERPKHFGRWVSGYFAHGEVPWALSFRDPLDAPSPTNERMSAGELARTIYAPGGASGSADSLIASAGQKYGVFDELRRATVFRPQESAWGDVELRYIWCDRSAWPVPWGFRSFRVEVEEARGSGQYVRKHSVVRVRGANHYPHWEAPAETLRLLLSDEASDVDLRDVIAANTSVASQ